MAIDTNYYRVNPDFESHVINDGAQVIIADRVCIETLSAFAKDIPVLQRTPVIAISYPGHPIDEAHDIDIVAIIRVQDQDNPKVLGRLVKALDTAPRQEDGRIAPEDFRQALEAAGGGHLVYRDGTQPAQPKRHRHPERSLHDSFGM